MATIIPRWEWRIFGAGPGAADDAFAALTPGPARESDELYLLSAAHGSVKVRDGLMDVELRREVGPGGLPRREPVMKPGFPLRPAEVALVFDALRIVPPAPARSAYTLGQFLAELVEPSGVVRAVKIHKRRVPYT